MAVVKADGFGHGALRAATTALASGATWLGVATCAEALQLRAEGVTAPILSWMHRPREDFAGALRADIDLGVSSVEQLRSVALSAEVVGTTASLHLKVDTGLHRNGALPGEDWPELVGLARDLELGGHVRVRGVMSQLISVTEPAAVPVRAQLRLFDDAVAVARDAGLRPELRHLANSAAALAAPEAHYDMIRPGTGLYGLEAGPRQAFGLRGAMSLRSELILVKRVPAGSGVSYNHDYVTTRDSTLALVPLGYTDGLPWSAARHAEVWIAGRRYPVAGRIAMNQLVVDLGGDTAYPGAEVVAFGPGTDGEPTLLDWARWAGTVPQDIATSVGLRVQRQYTNVGMIPRA